MKFTSNDIKNLDKVYRLNLINSITGIKPANLIVTRSKDEVDNVAIFSSVVHLGSNPAMIGFVMRPQSNINSDTYQNILDTKCYTINHITEKIYKKAHMTSGKTDQSEFDILDIDKESCDFRVPFIKRSPVQIGMKLLKTIDLPNKCIFIIGEPKIIIINDKIITSEGKINLSSGNIVGLSGLDGYYNLNYLDSLEYVRNLNDINLDE